MARLLSFTPLGLDFDAFLSHELIIAGAGILLLVVVGGLLYSIRKARLALPISEMRNIMKASGEAKNTREILPLSTRFSILLKNLIIDVGLQRTVFTCDRLQWFSHFGLLWGFLLLGLATTLDSLINPNVDPLPLTHIVRILGNIGGVLLVSGGTIAIWRRLTIKEVRDSTRPGDTFFLLVIYLTGVTGFLVEFTADLNLVIPTFYTYWIHISFVVLLLASAPFSKFSHAIWRPFWALYVRLEDEFTRRKEEIKYEEAEGAVVSKK